MTTATAEKPAAPSILGAPRAKKKSGMLRSGLGLIVGLEKSGKSALMASSGGLVIELDAGDGDHLDGWFRDIRPERDADGNITKTALNEFREVYGAALRDPKVEIIGIDTAGTFVDWQAQEIAEAAGLRSIMHHKEGVNGYELWRELNSRIEAFVKSVKDSGKLVLVAAHCKSPELDDEKRVVIPMGIDTYKGPNAILAKRADFIGYTYRKEVGGQDEYRISFRGGPLGNWGSRVDALNGKEFKLAKDNPWASLVAAAEGAKAAAAAETKTEASQNGKASKRR